MKTYQIRNEVTGEIVEVTRSRRMIKYFTDRFMRENMKDGKASRTFFKSIPKEGLKIIAVVPVDPRHEWHLALIPGDE